MQNLLIVNVPNEHATTVAGELNAAGLPVQASAFARGTVACTGSEFCKLALTETKGFARWLTEELDTRLPGFQEQIRLHVTGCPNSCGQHWIADIGIEGKKIKVDGTDGRRLLLLRRRKRGPICVYRAAGRLSLRRNGSAGRHRETPSRIQRAARAGTKISGNFSRAIPTTKFAGCWRVALAAPGGTRCGTRLGASGSRGLMGKVYLIGAGPGDPELLTLKAARLLERATIVLHDSLVSREVLQIASRDGAEIIDVGKRCGQKLLTQDEINALLVSYAARHASRHSPERRRSADLWPRRRRDGSSSPRRRRLRDRARHYRRSRCRRSRGNLPDRPPRRLSSCHHHVFARRRRQRRWTGRAVTSATTLVLYMPGADYAEVAQRLRDAGLPEDLPCVIVSNATTSQQQIRWTTVAGLCQRSKTSRTGAADRRRVAAHKNPKKSSRAYWRGEAQQEQ